MTPPPNRIRNIAVGLLVRAGHALVEIYPATSRHGVFARVPGGGIEFGEELAAALSAAHPIAITENIFTSGGVSGHEVVHVFAIESPELDGLPLDGELRVLDNHTTVRWVPLSALRADDPPLYPAGMIGYAEALDAAAGTEPGA